MTEGQVLMKIEISNSATSAETYHFKIEVEEKSWEFSVLLDRPIVDESGFLGDYDAKIRFFHHGAVCPSLTPQVRSFFREICLNTIYEFETPDGFDTEGHFERPLTVDEFKIFS